MLEVLGLTPGAVGIVVLLTSYFLVQEYPSCPVCKSTVGLEPYKQGPFPSYQKIFKCSHCNAIYNQNDGNVYYTAK